MTEDALQYIWKVQAIKKSKLLTVDGEILQILKQGILNSDSGPDFSSARVIIDGVDWVGDVEIHLKTSYWQRHKHQHDPAYNKVILHVVWEHDLKVLREDGSEIPTLELKNLVSQHWLDKYDNLRSSILIIPCHPFFKQVDEIHKIDAFNKALIERLQRKSQILLKNIDKLHGDWEQAAIHLIFEYFGFKKNNEAFKQLASITDARILGKLGTIVQMEAYLMGMAGLLTESMPKNEYRTKLLNEFKWLRKKFNITTEPMSATWWKFMRMRPANFPTIRLAQLAVLLVSRPHMFQSIVEVPIERATAFFRVGQSEFWQSHYHFNKVAKNAIKGMGEQSSRLLSINVAAVLLVAYGNYTSNEIYIEKAVSFLEAQKPENNVITRQWHKLDVTINNAAESQGAIELFNNYCKGRKCFQCNIGSQILNSK
jgi:Protein of unknown function (DUF2851)